MTRSTRWAVAAVALAVGFSPSLFVLASLLDYGVGWSWPYEALARLLTSRALARVPSPWLAAALVLALGCNVYATSRLALARGPATERRALELARRAGSLFGVAASALVLSVLAGVLFFGAGGGR
jgi:hypothetical protein